MASKRHLESLDPVVFNKLPRLEPEPSAAFPASLCKSSLLPSPGSENHFNYKGSYFTCPLRSPDGPEQPRARWSPSATSLQYGGGAGGQPVPAEGSLVSLLYRPESLGSGLQPPGATKGKDSLMRELLMAREKRTSPLPALGHPFPVKKPVAVNKAVTLAVPKPVYGPLACFMDPRMALPLGPRAESLRQRLGDGDWPLPAATPTSHHPLRPGEPRGGTGLHRRGPHPDPSLLPLHPSLALPKKVGSPAAFSPYYTTFEKYRDPPSTPFLEASCSTIHSQKKLPEVPSLSPDPWPKLQLPHASPVYRERPPLCYPHPSYPLPLPKAALFFPPPPPTVEAQHSPLPSAYRGFSFVGTREPFPSVYLKPQALRSFSPSPLDTYIPRAGGTVTSPPAKAVAVPRDAEPPRRAGYLQPSPGFPFSPGDAAVLGTFGSTEPGCEGQGAESPPQPAVTRHSSAFQPVCSPEEVPAGSQGLPEVFSDEEEGWEKLSHGEEEPPYPESREGSPDPPAPVVTGDSDACMVKDAAKELIPPSPPASPPVELKIPSDGKVSPSSPPMPVINKVFSLAPYRDYLEWTTDSPQAPISKEHVQGDTSPQNMGDSQEPTALRGISAMSSLSPTGTVANQKLKMGNDVVQGQGESCYRRVPEEPKVVPQDLGSREGSPSGVGSKEPAPKGVVLDLSLKKRVVKVKETPRPIGRAEGTPGREDGEEEKEAPGEKVEVGDRAKPLVQPVMLEIKSNFQSSATFMFKKFKLLHSLPLGTVPPLQASSPPAPQPSTPALPGAPPDPQQPPLPEAPPMLGEESISPPRQCDAPAPQSSPSQHFTTLHTSLCNVISCSVSRSSPELLREWLKKAEELGEMPKSPPKPKNGCRIPDPQKPPKGKEIWLAFQDVAALLTTLLSQLETFTLARNCPFPHVVRAGTVFIPIHVVKEKLFPKLPGASVDQVLQEHKVELRPTTLSEERHLRELELKSCTLRMLKLLAVKQLPDIYPDLLNLHWHDSIRQQLGSSSQAGQNPSK
ncbi:uncharacterized protein C15orf39 homolog isoform 1-T2 [Podargus strigoides]